MINAAGAAGAPAVGMNSAGEIANIDSSNPFGGQSRANLNQSPKLNIEERSPAAKFASSSVR